MKTTITKRKLKPLYEFLILLTVFLLIRQHFATKVELLMHNLAEIYKSNIELGKLGHPDFELGSEYFESLQNKIHSLEEYFGLTILIMSFIIFLNLSSYFKNIKHKIFVFIVEFCLVWTIFSCTTTELRLNAVEDDNYFISLLIFMPFLYFVYHISIIGKTIDITGEIKRKNERLLNEGLNDLDKLLKLNLLTKEEYNQKKEFQIKEKLKIEIKDSEEYILLSKSRQKGLFSKDEFKIKFEELINANYNKMK